MSRPRRRSGSSIIVLGDEDTLLLTRSSNIDGVQGQTTDNNGLLTGDRNNHKIVDSKSEMLTMLSANQQENGN